ncbi:sigma factor-like helix-turn-helix DNA-binding protein [Tessaracoccus sp.]
MGITSAVFLPPLASASEEHDLARRIEAGVYAEHLLDTGSLRPPHDLERIARSGKQAWDTLWLSNLRLVAKLSHTVARRHCLPFDDVFQDGCLGLAEALMRFDFTRGWRFSTLSHEYIQRFVTASAARRAGELDGPGRRHRLRILLRQRTAELSALEHREPPVREVARRLGISMSAAAGAWTIATSLDEVGSQQLSSDGGFETIEVNGLDFLDLLTDAGDLLRLRYGLGTRCHTQAEIAERLGVSASTVARMEKRALARARAILESDQCRVPKTAG